jgi:hypothetical protein
VEAPTDAVKISRGRQDKNKETYSRAEGVEERVDEGSHVVVDVDGDCSNEPKR